jgi:anaerobic selenocysteine-containing dehydrogenase
LRQNSSAAFWRVVMSAVIAAPERKHGFCSLCIARCGTVATVEDGRFIRLDPDPNHPTGTAICAKGRAAPELTYHKERLTRPLRRKNPKGGIDPGWEEISWDAALDEIATAMRRSADEFGPQSVAFSQSSTSTTAIADSAALGLRLMNAFGTPNLVTALELCGWGRGFATRYVYGVGSVGTGRGGAMADIGQSGCLILWGYNPSISRITHATATVAGLKRGMKLIVIDPRNAGLTNKADQWLRVRPGTDGALALGLANIMIERGWYDRRFIQEWTNGPLLVRDDTGRLLRASDVSSAGHADGYFAWDPQSRELVAYDAKKGCYDKSSALVALGGDCRIETRQGPVVCRPVFDHYASLCKKYSPAVIEATCWIPAAQLVETASLIWHARPTSYYAWSGHEQHANTTENARAIAMLYAMTGCFDAPGGNVLLPAIPAINMAGDDLPSAKRLAPAIGLEKRPLGPARWNTISAHDLYTAILDKQPYPVRALIGFGANMLVAQADPDRGRKALAALNFYAHIDLFMNPTAELADIVLPAASCFECATLKIGFEISESAQSRIQLRQPVVPPPGEARSDTDIIFALATRLGLGEHFWNGNVEAAWRYQLSQSGVTLEQLCDAPAGIQVPLKTRYTKHADADGHGNAKGFATPSRKIEFWSETFLDHGYSPLPEFVEPRTGPNSEPQLLAQFPLVLTCAKPTLFCQTQHRALPSLRRRAPDPEVELHPDAAASRKITDGSWVSIETPIGSLRAKARLNEKLDPRVVVGEHGWWQGCKELGIQGYDPFSPDGANFNRTIDSSDRDPVGGTPGHRANLCQISLSLAAPADRQ